MNSKPDDERWGERTRAVHSGEGVDPNTRASSPNIVMSATFAQSDVGGFSALNRSEDNGFSYARVSNPTVSQLADKIAALEVARFLEPHPAVTRVLYPGLPSHPQHDLARRQMRNTSGMMTFQTRADGRKVAERMIDTLEVIHYAVSLGHHRSLIYWIPTEMLMQSTFRLAPAAEARYRDFAGDGVFRLSVGIEDADDLCADLDRALTG